MSGRAALVAHCGEVRWPDVAVDMDPLTVMRPWIAAVDLTVAPPGHTVGVN